MVIQVNEAGYCHIAPRHPWNLTEDCKAWGEEHGLRMAVIQRLAIHPERQTVTITEYAEKDGKAEAFYIDPLTDEPAIKEPYTIALKREPNLSPTYLAQQFGEWERASHFYGCEVCQWEHAKTLGQQIAAHTAHIEKGVADLAKLVDELHDPDGEEAK